MPARICNILFEKDFNDSSGKQFTTTSGVSVTDNGRRAAFINEINIILSKKSKKHHLLPPIILQLIRLRFPNDLDQYKFSNLGIDVSIQEFVQWTMNVK
jgi:hypothetical protein